MLTYELMVKKHLDDGKISNIPSEIHKSDDFFAIDRNFKEVCDTEAMFFQAVSMPDKNIVDRNPGIEFLAGIRVTHQGSFGLYLKSDVVTANAATA